MSDKRAYRVLKFGGSSVASATAMSGVLDIVEKEAALGRVILVSSAISGCTDALLGGNADALEAIRQRHAAIVRRLFTGHLRTSVQERVDGLFEELAAAPSDEKVTFGELLSTTILEEKLRAEGYDVLWLDSRELVVSGNEPETFRRIAAAVSASSAQVFVAPGFICRDASGKVSTLGRGGSDYSAALYAAAVNAASLQIWTDVPGIMTANPKQVPAARTIPVMSYSEAFTMADSGAKVLYAPTVAPAMAAGIDIEIRNTFAPAGAFTVIGKESAGSKVGVASSSDGIALVGSIADDDILAAREALLEAGISPLEVVPSSGKCVFKVKPIVDEKALRAIHNAFFVKPSSREIPVFIAGYGAVGKALADAIGRGAESIAEKTGKKLVVAGIASSRRFSINLSGLPVIEPTDSGNFVEEVCRVAPRGAVFVDATSSETIWKDYERIMSRGINIVSSNRRSLSVPYADYAAMHATARENGVYFRYETTVGAALPILESISRGAFGSDEILSLEAVVSCTLNRILDEYVPGDRSFASLVYDAWTEGLTETNPALDLGGRDALRKLLILVREAGVHIDVQNVDVQPLIPQTMNAMSPEEFWNALEAMESTFSEAASAAARNGRKLRYVARYNAAIAGGRAAGADAMRSAAPGETSAKSVPGYATIGLQAVAPEHPAYYLKGTENAIIVRSALKPYPLLIKGPGEGALEAASSILSDILR